MKNEYKVWYNHGSYFLKSFPKLNTTLVWDDTNKSYHFRNGIIDTNDEKSIEPLIKERESIIKPFDYKWLVIGALSGTVIGLLASILIILR